MAEQHEDPFEALNGLGPEASNSERVRRMKRLMQQLYKEEFESKRVVLPHIKGKSLIVLLSFVSIIVFGVTTLYNFNRFVTLEERVLSAKGHVADVLQRRANLFSNLINLTLNQAALEQEVFRHVANVRAEVGRSRTNSGTGASAPVPPPAAAPVGPSAPTDLVQALAASDGSPSLAKLLAIVEQYPEISSSVTYQQLMDKLVEMENRITDKRDIYNEEVRVFNTLITTFPWYVLSKITGFERFDYFTFSENSMTHAYPLPDLTHETFIRLLPLSPEHPTPTDSPQPIPEKPATQEAVKP